MKKILQYIGLGILAIILMIALFIAIVFRATQGPADIVKTFFDEIAAGEYTSAYELTSDIFQENTPIEAIADFGDNEPVMLTYTRTTLNQRSIEGNQATVSGAIEGLDGSILIESTLTQENDNWLIDSVAFTYPDDLPMDDLMLDDISLDDINLEDLDLTEEELAELEALLAE